MGTREVAEICGVTDHGAPTKGNVVETNTQIDSGLGSLVLAANASVEATKQLCDLLMQKAEETRQLQLAEAKNKELQAIVAKKAALKKALRIAAGRRDAEKIRRISELFDKSITDSLSDVKQLREGIREAEAYCSEMESMLNRWIDK